MPRRKRRPRELPSSPSAAPEPDIIALSDDDGKQGTADLTLDILAKAKSRGRERSSNGSQAQVIDLESEEDVVVRGGAGGMELQEDEAPILLDEAVGAEAAGEPVVSTKGKKRKQKKQKKKEKTKETSANVVNMEGTKAEPDKPAEMELPDAEESLAMRKLLRGPRYFDPPEEQGEACYSCGQQGHRAADCTEQPRQKPCYVCGNFGHDGYDCAEKTECFECGKSGHVARNCPNKQYQPRRATGLCLLCGRLGHDASTCSGEYDPNDFKQVHCYICNGTGHMCCIEVVDASSTPVSCYQCGDLGHTGLGCTRQTEDTGERSSCYRCGQEGHFARECQQTNREYNIKQGCTRQNEDTGERSSCYRCGQEGHFARECPQTNREHNIKQGCTRQNEDTGERSACYRCGQEGHFARECPQTNREHNIKQRRHSWPAPWSADNGRFGDQEPPFPPACHIRPVPLEKPLEQAPGENKQNVGSKSGTKRKRKEADDKSTDSHLKRSRD